MKNSSPPPPKKKNWCPFRNPKTAPPEYRSVPTAACLRADSHYTSRVRSVAKRHLAVKFSHV